MGEAEKYVVVDVKAAERVQESMKKERDKLGYVCNLYRSISRVPPYIRGQNKSDYDPKLISIGPYHHRAPAALQNKSLKWRYLQDLIFRSETNSLDTYVNAIFKHEKAIRACYLDIKLERDALVKMMVLDGCFIVEFLIKQYLKEKDKCMGGAAKWNLEILQNDLLLLENQIPFLVLKEIFDNSTIKQDNPCFRKLKEEISLRELATAYVAFDNHKAIERLRRVSSTRPPVAEKDPDPHHLLHLRHQSFKPKSVRSATELKEAPRVDKDAPASCFPIPVRCPDKEGQRAATIRSATELEDAGVKFRRKKNKEADSCSLLDVTFRGGTMEIPKLSIRETTRSWLRNLLAFEQCYPEAGSHFTSYTALLNNLVDTPDDVALLKNHDIIKSKLGGDDDVAKLFNELCRGAYLDCETHYLAELFKDVKRYSDAPRHKWRATLVHDYFGSPWATISVIAAVILLALTLAQTFFTIFPYYRPRS